ncbi:MAG: hypothetical protein R6V41_07995 [Desulfobacteraceae bacterium]
MGLFDKIKKGFESAVVNARMDDFLIDRIDKILSERWDKVSEKKPDNIDGVSIEEEAGYKFVYRFNDRAVEVELEHEYPVVKMEIHCDGSKYETHVQVSEFVEKEENGFSIKNETKLREIISGAAGMVE